MYLAAYSVVIEGNAVHHYPSCALVPLFTEVMRMYLDSKAPELLLDAVAGRRAR